MKQAPSACWLVFWFQRIGRNAAPVGALRIVRRRGQRRYRASPTDFTQELDIWRGRLGSKAAVSLTKCLPEAEIGSLFAWPFNVNL